MKPQLNDLDRVRQGRINPRAHRTRAQVPRFLKGPQVVVAEKNFGIIFVIYMNFLLTLVKRGPTVTYCAVNAVFLCIHLLQVNVNCMER